MSTQRGIFETFPNQAPPAGAPPVSPFAIAPEARTQSAPSPFMAAAPAAKRESPFSVVREEADQTDPRSTRLPERRKPTESPFQMAEPQGFGFEAPQQAPQALKASPFEQAPQAPQPLQASPFQVEQAPVAPQPAFQPAVVAWPQAEIIPTPAPQAFVPAPQTAAPAPQYAAPAPQYAAPAPQHAAPSAESQNSDSHSIKQIELRAIFGVDREMTKDEIIQRSRSLPGIRQIAQVNEQDIAAVDALKQVISNLGFGNSAIKLYSGSVPIEFIREGRTLLAVQTDGGFAPGVRETLMLVARELSK